MECHWWRIPDVLVVLNGDLLRGSCNNIETGNILIESRFPKIEPLDSLEFMQKQHLDKQAVLRSAT